MPKWTDSPLNIVYISKVFLGIIKCTKLSNQDLKYYSIIKQKKGGLHKTLKENVGIIYKGVECILIQYNGMYNKSNYIGKN